MKFSNIASLDRDFCGKKWNGLITKVDLAEGQKCHQEIVLHFISPFNELPVLYVVESHTL